MPLPFILWVLLLLWRQRVYFKGVEASNNFDKAKGIGEDAELEFKKASKVLDGAREETQAALAALGKLKFIHLAIKLNTSLKRSRSEKTLRVP